MDGNFSYERTGATKLFLEWSPIVLLIIGKISLLFPVCDGVRNEDIKDTETVLASLFPFHEIEPYCSSHIPKCWV